MATTEASSETAHEDHGHDHDHPAFLAHHFDTPEQQFDSGKLGIWLFLVTEVLFFSGMFCAYAMFRALRPDVFEGCSQFLNTKLGAINTGVLLFSSLTMAWAVRCAQTEDHKTLTGMLAATLSCAMVFLGVKAIEYSHKWGMGLLPAGLFFYDPNNQHPTAEQLELIGFGSFGVSFLQNALFYICAPFAIGLIGVVIWLVVSLVNGRKFQVAVAKPLTVVFVFFFVGVGLGRILESGESHDSHDSHAVAHVDGHDAHQAGDHASDQHAGDAHAADSHSTDPPAGDHDSHGSPVEDGGELAVLERLAAEKTNTGLQDDLAARQRQSAVASGAIVHSDEITSTIETVPEEVLTPSRAGVFFSIYYCMTGVHAIHIIGGIIVLIWLLVRSVRQDFNRQYFGPVDYVGLYWHLVDLIWIYLFPLLYLIR